MSEHNNEVRITKKVRKGHGGHHGGAWKVAYADFVTAMMAFFLVMWIVGLNQAVKESIASYFKDPIGFMRGAEQGRKPLNIQAPGALQAPDLSMDVRKNSLELHDRQKDKERFERAKREIESQVQKNPEFRNLSRSIQVRIVPEGLRIDLMESSMDVFFDSGSATPKPHTRDLLVQVARELGKLPNKIVIEGHTDSRPFQRNGMTNWELSAARANAARAIMETSGVRSGQIVEVRGLADRMPIDPVHRDSYRNRRVSILLPFLDSEPSETIDMKDIKPEISDVKPNIAGSIAPKH